MRIALIESGYELADASALVSRVRRLMSKELGDDPDAPLTEAEVPEVAQKPRRVTCSLQSATPII